MVYLQNKTKCKNYIQNVPTYKYKAWYKAYTRLEIGYLVTPKTDPGDYIIESTGDITVYAGESIVLKPGFHAQNGSTFHASIKQECAQPPANVPVYTTSIEQQYNNKEPQLAENTRTNEKWSEVEEKCIIEFYNLEASKTLNQSFGDTSEDNPEEPSKAELWSANAVRTEDYLKYSTMKTKIILMLFSFLLLGCNKETVNFHIKIINPATGEGYANHQFYIKSSRTGANGEKVKTRYSGTLNANGEAIVTLKVNRDTWFVTCEAVSNTCYINNPKQHYSNRSDLNPEFVFEIVDCAFLQINVKNINCQGANDKVVFHFKPINYSYDYMSHTERLGCYENEFIPNSVPMGDWQATWHVTKNGVTTYHDSLFYIPVNQLFYFNLFY